MYFLINVALTYLLAEFGDVGPNARLVLLQNAFNAVVSLLKDQEMPTYETQHVASTLAALKHDLVERRNRRTMPRVQQRGMKRPAPPQEDEQDFVAHQRKGRKPEGDTPFTFADMAQVEQHIQNIPERIIEIDN